MVLSDSMQLIFVAIVSLLAGGALLAFFSRPATSDRAAAREYLTRAEANIAFLFDDVDLVDATPAAQTLIRHPTDSRTDWEAFISVFGPQFPHLRRHLSTLATDGHKIITSPDSPDIRIVADYWDGMARLVYEDARGANGHSLANQATIKAIEAQIESYQAIAEDSPMLIWKEHEDRSIIWANRAYLAKADGVQNGLASGIATWPPQQIFENLDRPEDDGERVTGRTPVHLPDQVDPSWYEVTSIRHGAEVVHFAIDVSAIVRAETTQRNFVTTLGKTFAELSIGLAIFNRNRKLMIFNPALIDLTNLTVEFLSGQPTVNAVLDRLREGQMLPEPKNYKTWREEVAALESAAKDGNYCETWELPNGRTYRVTGRPHPDGAIAFLFEDISAEVSLTRRFRSEIELSHAVLDSLDEAVAVFNASGTMTMANSAYCKLWHKPATGLTESGILDEARQWQESCAPTPVWGEVCNFVGRIGERSAWEELVIMNDGRHYSCKVSPLPGGATLAAFRRVRDMAPTIHQPLGLEGRMQQGV